MFLDERISEAQGRTFRFTVIFAWAVTVVYGILHFLMLMASGPIPLSSLSVELICGIGGAVIIGKGELSRWSKTKDEMWAYERNKYYSKAFYIFLYMLLFAYCCIRVPAYIVLSPYDMPPNQLLILLELTCFIVLITRFKLSDVPFNYTFISEERRSYAKQVLVNVGKLGGAILLFTSLSFVTLFFIGGEAIDMLSVLFSGLFTFLSLSGQYILFSVAEWLSDRAQEKGVISVSTLFFFFSAAVFAVGAAAIGLYCSVDNGHLIVTSAHAVLISSLLRYFALMETALLAVFAAYLYSETGRINASKLRRSVNLFAFATVLEITVSEFFRLLSSAVMNGQNEAARGLFTVLGYTNQFFSLVFTVLTAVAVYMGAKALSEKGLAPKWTVIIPILRIIQSAGFFVWKIVLQSWAATIGDYLVVFFFMGVYTFWMIVGAMRIKKLAAANAEKEESK
ncbi:MAG: hypothetical protein E7634_06070 [Ruminococcaceae bacterium]|nr:hypothetical protein [Oscillospiraceae bacterium]